MVQIKIYEQLTDIEASQWNRLVPADAPFLRHEFLASLERTGCVSSKTGWVPQHIAVWGPGPQEKLVGAVPLYLKSHSYGEYVFDWAWANAYERAGLEYYPKLVAAVPFTPVSGPRILLEASDANGTRRRCIQQAQELALDLGLSSLHWLFTSNDDIDGLLKCNFLRRVGTQFHWHNEGYGTFDDYLNALSSRKRKKVRRERRRVCERGIRMEVITAEQLSPHHMDIFNRFYRSTIRQHGAIPYLSLDFFRELATRMPENIVLILARKHRRYIAGALNIRGSSSLYGRYWGAAEWHPDLHFETCYYRAIEYCIDHQLLRFEAGAQGEHKLNRGFLPTPTYSAHWLRHPEFSAAVSNFLHRETEDVAQYMDLLESHVPYRRNI